MTTENSLSRREFTKKVSMATGFGLLSTSIISASIVTPKQVEGPFHPIDSRTDLDMDLTLIKGHKKPAIGEVLLVSGLVLDVDTKPISDATVDVWQANHFGRYSHPKDLNTAPIDPNFQDWGIMNTTAEGSFSFKTIKPGPYPLSFLGEEGTRCRHIHFKVTRPGYKQLITQMYFHGDPLISQDLEVAKVPEENRHLLIRKSSVDKDTGLPIFKFNLTLDRL